MGWLQTEDISQLINQAFTLNEVVAIKELVEPVDQDQREQERKESAAEHVMAELLEQDLIKPVDKEDADWLEMIAGLDPQTDFYYEDPEYYERLQAIRYTAKTKDLPVFKGWDL